MQKIEEWERCRQAEKAKLMIENLKQDPFQFVSVLL